LITTFKDAKILALIEKLAKDTEKDTSMNSEILCSLLNIDTLNATNRFFDLAKTSKPKYLKQFYCLVQFMTDSVERAKLYYDKMITLVEKPFEDYYVVSITNSLAQEDTAHVMKNIFDQYTPQYLAAANALFEKTKTILIATKSPEKDSVNDDFYAISSYIRLFKNLDNTPETNQFFKKLLVTQREYMFSNVIYYLLKNGETIDNALWQRLQKDKGILTYFLKDAEEGKLLAKVPPQYLNQKDIAEGNILNMLEEDYGKPDVFTFVETQKHKGEIVYVYKFSTKYEDEISQYIAICSQPSDKSKYKLEPNILMVSDILTDGTPLKKVVENMLKN
jgi:hypothetical protein